MRPIADTKRTVVFLVLQASMLLFSSGLHAQSLDGWKLVWSDEFNAASLDTTKWGLELNEGDPGIAAYTKRTQNLFVQGGNLVLQAQKETYNGKQYTATQISSRNKGSWKYCRIDVRAKLPFGQRIWPAIWMMPQQPVAYGGWPRSGEIDIMENLGDNTRLTYTTLHFGNSNQSVQGKYTVSANQTLSDSFHVYTMVWDSGSFSFTLDSVHNYYTTKNWSPDNVSFPKPFDQPFFLMFDLAVGGSWGGLPDSTTVFPQKFLVDWVRVYQRQPVVAARQAKPVNPGGGLSVQSIANQHAIIIRSQIRGKTIIRLINVAGECVLRKEIMMENQTEIQTHRLPAGIYQVYVTLSTSAEVIKAVCVVSQ